MEWNGMTLVVDARSNKIDVFFFYPVSWTCSLFVWLVADGWCWFVLREKYRWLVASG
jgi:hypothetical protein